MSEHVSFDLQPVLKGALVELRPLRADDCAALYAVAADPLIWEQHHMQHRHEEEAFKDFFHEQLASGGALLAIDAQTGDVVGMSRFHGYHEKRSEIEIGWTFLARSHWGGVYNREMKGLMLRHAFRFVRSVVFLVDPQNLRSRRAIEKIGAVQVGSRLDGGGHQSIAYQIEPLRRRPALGRLPGCRCNLERWFGRRLSNRPSSGSCPPRRAGSS